MGFRVKIPSASWVFFQMPNRRGFPMFIARRNFIVVAVCGLTFAVAGVGADLNAQTPPQAPAAQPASKAYRLVVGDAIQIVVQGHSELDQPYTVPADGDVSFPPLGKVRLLDRTLGELEKEVADRLKSSRQLTAPVVYVLIITYAPRKAFLLGAINRDIDLPIYKDYTIVMVLSLAGASPAVADLKNVKIRRKKRDGTYFPIPVNVEDILLKDEYEKDLKVMPDDIIYIPPIQNLTQQAHVYVLGKVAAPGEYSFNPALEQMTLLKILAKAGDITPFGRPSAIRILRKEGNRTHIIRIDFSDIIDGEMQDVVLKENDMVFVPESIF